MSATRRHYPTRPHYTRAQVAAAVVRRIDFRGSDECWPFLGSTPRNGYGQVYVHGRQLLIHRVMFEAMVGPIPADLEIDHLCRTRHCANPRHMEAVTHLENMRRGVAARRLVAPSLDAVSA